MINVKETEKSTLKSWNVTLVNEALSELRKELVACKGKQDALSLQEGLLALLKKHMSSLPDWLVEDQNQVAVWNWKLALDEARLNAVAMEPNVRFAAIEGQLKDVPRPSPLDDSDRLASTALSALSMAERSEADLLKSEVIDPLAELCRQDGKFQSLTTTERSSIVEVLQSVRTQTDQRMKREGSTPSATASLFSRDMAGNLEVITGIRVPLLLQINAVRSALETAASSDDFVKTQGLLTDAYKSLTVPQTSSASTATDNAALQRIEELELLLFLRTPTRKCFP